MTIELESLTKSYRGHAVVDDVSLEVAEGEWVALLGPSGSGKSTILSMIAGLTSVSSGRIRIQGRDVTSLAPQHRDVAMVFQSYALYPHMTVRDNIAFGMRTRKVPRVERVKRVEQAAKQLSLEALLDRKPSQLSGGQRQRVAMGRAIVREPNAFLLDEPLSNLDAELRGRVRTELAELRDRLRITTVYVTHDQVEAMTLGDRLAVLKEGRLQQVGTGSEIYENPANRFVAGFIGRVPMNFVEGVELSQGVLHLADTAIPAATSIRGDWSGRRLVVGIRPTALEASQYCSDRQRPRIDGTAGLVEDLGSEKVVQVRVAHGGPGGCILTACLPTTARVRPGEPLELAVDPSSLYFFDPDSGASLGRNHAR